MEPKVLEHRLLLRESTVGFVSLNRCANKFNLMLKGLDNSNGDSDLTTLQSSFVREMLLYGVELNKTNLLIKSYNDELEIYNSKQLKLENEINQINNNIELLENQLIKEKIIRKHRENIELLASVVNQLVPCSERETSINELLNNKSVIEQTLKEVDSNVLIRYDQYNNLLQSLESLLVSLYPISDVQISDNIETYDIDDNEETSDRHRDMDNQLSNSNNNENEYETEEEGDVDKQDTEEDNNMNVE